jgi:gluconolactonase
MNRLNGGFCLSFTFAVCLANLSKIGAAEGIVPAGSHVERVARAEAAQATPFTEGPAYKDDHLYFTDTNNSRILRVHAGQQGALPRVPEIFREPSGRANGLEFDSAGRLLACEGGGSGGQRRVTRTEHNGMVTILADRYEGKRLNSPNDLAVDAKDRIYFTDPRYGDRSDLELDKESVYRIDSNGKLTRVIADVQRPNGIAVSTDQKTLYVVDNHQGKDGARKVYGYALRPDGSAGARRLIHDFGTGRGGDGMCLDNEGNIYVAAGLNGGFSAAQDDSVKAGVYIFSPRGKALGFIPIPEDSVTNCTFGDRDLRTLYITAGTSLWKIRLNARGRQLPAGRR